MWRPQAAFVCGGAHYLKEIFFKVKEILLSVRCKYAIIIKVVH